MSVVHRALLLACLASASASAAPDLKTIGPKVGAALPAFELRDQLGRAQTLASLTGAEGLMLVFSRSADW